MEQQDIYICAECSKDIYLKNYVQKNSTNIASCNICLQEKPALNASLDPIIVDFCRFLIRFHFPEYIYNPHWGGNDLPELFYSDNPIILHSFSEREDMDTAVEEFLYELFDINNTNSKIELYYGHNDIGRGLFPYAMKDEKSNTWVKYKKELTKKNFFLLEEDAKKTFANLLNDLKFNLNSDVSYFRARIGYKEETEQIIVSEVKIKVPFSDDDISSPPISKAKAGRANRQGVAFLYLASSKETALGEVRPHPGHYVSIGEFISKKELVFADLRFVDLVKYFKDEKQQELFKLLKDLSDELSIPILPEEQENYLVTQFISDIIRQLNFDGILFNSSVSDGYNLVIFDTNNFSYKKGSAELIKITSVRFEYKKTEYDIDHFLEVAIEK